MRRISILVSFVAIALLAIAAVGPSAAGRTVQDATPAAAAGHPVVGSWLAYADIDDPANPPLLFVFHADGIYTEVDANGDPGAGVWETTGPRTAAVTIVHGVLADEDGGPGGIATIRASFEVAADGQRFTADYTVEFAGPDGSSGGEFGPGTATGERIAVEPMGTPVGPLADLFGEADGGSPTASTPASSVANVVVTTDNELTCVVGFGPGDEPVEGELLFANVFNVSNVTVGFGAAEATGGATTIFAESAGLAAPGNLVRVRGDAGAAGECLVAES